VIAESLLQRAGVADGLAVDRDYDVIGCEVGIGSGAIVCDAGDGDAIGVV
jgi:hypothetical protein